MAFQHSQVFLLYALPAYVGDGMWWGTVPYFPERIFSPPSKETPKDHLGAMKQINKSLQLRVQWLPHTLKHACQPARLLLSPEVLLFDIGKNSSVPSRLLPHWWWGWERAFQQDDCSTRWVPTQLSTTTCPPVLYLYETRALLTLWGTCSLPSLSTPFFKTLQASEVSEVDNVSWKFLEVFPILEV